MRDLHDDDHTRLLVIAALLVSGGCRHCARALLGFWTGSDLLLEQLEAVVPAESVHRAGAWRRIQFAIAARGHQHEQDRAQNWRPLLDFLDWLIHSEADPDRLPPVVEVPAVFVSALD